MINDKINTDLLILSRIKVMDLLEGRDLGFKMLNPETSTLSEGFGAGTYVWTAVMLLPEISTIKC